MEWNFPQHFYCKLSQTLKGNIATETRSLWSILCSHKMELYLQWAEVIIWNGHKSLAMFLNGKNANNKVNRWGLELVTYNITFKWIWGAQNKAADFLSRLVELPHDRQATVQMLSATNYDGPTFHTRSRTAQGNMTDNLTPCPKTHMATLDITNIKDTPDAMPNHSTKIDYKHYIRCRGQILSVSAPPNPYEMAEHWNMKLISSYMWKDFSINVMDSNQKF